jgi:hypothetical protein
MSAIFLTNTGILIQFPFNLLHIIASFAIDNGQIIHYLYNNLQDMHFQNAIKTYSGQPLTQQILMHLLRDYRWPHNKIAQLVKQGYLTPIKRGLYITGPELNMPQPSNYLLANHLYGPSYISLEAALAYRAMIPEKVSTITSMTTGAAKSFRTKKGRFDYLHAGLPYYSYGIEQVRIDEQQTVLMASREKALCDKIVTTAGVLLRSMEQTMNFLTDDMRIETEDLQKLDKNAIQSWVDHAPKKQSLIILVKTLENL